MTSTTAELFTGTWLLLSQTTTRNGTPVPNFGLGYHVGGTLIFDQSGYFSAVLQATAPETQRSALSILDSSDRGLDAEWARAAKQSMAYSGPWTIDEVKGELVNGPVIAASLAGWIGTLQRRKFTFSENGTRLRLEGDLGSGVYTTLEWEKARRNSTTVGVTAEQNGV